MLSISTGAPTGPIAIIGLRGHSSPGQRFFPRFGTQPYEAGRADPQLAALLELSWEALEDAALLPAQLAGPRTGIFVGLPGRDRDGGGQRIARLLNVSGPVEERDAPGLVCVHEACCALRAGACDIALAGAIDPPQAAAGSGILVLKPLTAAERDGDAIHGVILATGIVIPPEPAGQDSLAQAVQAACGLLPYPAADLPLPANHESAGGLANMIAALLALRDRRVPTLRAAEPARFGFGDPGAHAVVREQPMRTRPASQAIGTQRLLLLSAWSEAALRDMAGDWAAWLRDRPACEWADICATAALCRIHYAHRLAIAAASPQEAADRLAAIGTHDNRQMPGLAAGRAGGTVISLAFVYSGSALSEPAIGRELLAASPVFAAELAAIDAIFAVRTGWSLAAELTGPGGVRPGRARPMLFAVQLGLTAMLRQAGITPSVVLGHDVGEVAAAHVSGALSRAQAVEVLIQTRLDKLLPRATTMPFVSASGHALPGTALTGTYWADHRNATPRFADALRNLDINTVIDLGEETPDIPGTIIPVLRRPTAAAFWQAVCTCHALGAAQPDIMFDKPTLRAALPLPKEASRFFLERRTVQAKVSKQALLF